MLNIYLLLKRKYPTRQFYKISVLGVVLAWFPGKSYMFLQSFKKDLLENLICSYDIFFSWKILCALTKFWTRSAGKYDIFWKSYVFLQNFEKALLEILMCSSTFCLSWKFTCVLVPFLVLLENLMCFCKRIMSSAWKIHMFSYYILTPREIWCFQKSL